MMKKIFCIALFTLNSVCSITASASAIVNLSTSGAIAPNSSLNISLSGLVPAASYSVVCYIITSYPFHYILLGTHLSTNASSIISYSINGHYVTQDQLLIGNNLMVIDGTFANPTLDNLVITNLDQINPFNINKCFAIPIQIAQR